MSEANRARLLYVAETNWGQTPSGPPTLTVLRRTGGSFSQNPSHSTSAEVRSDRMVQDVIRTGIAPSASIDFETSYGAQHDLYEGVFMNDWTTAAATPSTADTVTIAASGDTFTRSAGSFITDGFAVGMWVKWAGWTNSANNDYFRISALTATVMTVEDDDGNLVDEGPTALTTVSAENDGHLRPGTTFKSFTFEEEYQDVTNSFMVYRGMTLGSLTLNVTADSIITGTFGDMQGGTATSGVNAVERVTATVGDGSPTAAPTNSIHSAVDNVFSKREGGTANSVLANSLSITLNNNLRGLAAVGNLGPADINLGTVNVTGSYNGYHGAAAHAVIDKLVGDTASSQSFRITDGAGNTEIWTIPLLKYTNGTPEMGSLDSDVPVNFNFTGYGAFSVTVDRIAA